MSSAQLRHHIQSFPSPVFHGKRYSRRRSGYIWMDTLRQLGRTPLSGTSCSSSGVYVHTHAHTHTHARMQPHTHTGTRKSNSTITLVLCALYLLCLVPFVTACSDVFKAILTLLTGTNYPSPPTRPPVPTAPPALTLPSTLLSGAGLALCDV